MKTILTIIVGLCVLTSCKPSLDKNSVIELSNPILPGYFADPSLVQYEGKFYLYVTADPWGTDFLSCWISDDFQNWTFHKLNWPTKQECISPASRPNMVWAPSVIREGEFFYMYVSVGSEVWCGKSTHPLGPWENALNDIPMIADDPTGYYHVIDAEAFIDDDGKAYLYWGSGWDWVNGHCFAAELNDDMSSFRTTPVEVTPTRYFEAPLMLKHNNNYYLTYSEGKTIDETYEVRYAIGDNPLGPFTEAANSPILKTDENLQVYGPGHHTVFTYGDKNYILYHRHHLPFNRGEAYRQTCISELTFNDDLDEINSITPHHTQALPIINQSTRCSIKDVTFTASSHHATHIIGNVSDNSYATRWESDDVDNNPSVTATFNGDTIAKLIEIRFEYPWGKYFCKIEGTEDGKMWDTITDYSVEGISGSPVNIPITKRYTNIRICFTYKEEVAKPSIWEICFYSN
jgi:beta-xylosidase